MQNVNRCSIMKQYLPR